MDTLCLHKIEQMQTVIDSLQLQLITVQTTASTNDWSSMIGFSIYMIIFGAIVISAIKWG